MLDLYFEPMFTNLRFCNAMDLKVIDELSVALNEIRLFFGSSPAIGLPVFGDIFTSFLLATHNITYGYPKVNSFFKISPNFFKK